MLFTFSPSKPASGHLLACIALPLLWALTACAVPPAPAASAPPLWSTTWQLEDLGGRGVLDRAQATLAFPEAGRVAGQGSCNRFFGSVTVDGSRIGFGQIASTRMACVAAVNEQESRYLAALQKAERYEVQGSTLLVHVQGLDKPLRFIRTGP